MPASKIVDEEEAVRWYEEGKTYAWFVQQYKEKYNIETSEPMWAAWRRRRGLKRRNLRDDDLIPWKLKEEHRHLYPVMMLRLEARRRENERAEKANEEPAYQISKRDMDRLKSWKQTLTEGGLVVHYDPETTDGFFLVPRGEKDKDLIHPPTRKTGNKARD